MYFDSISIDKNPECAVCSHDNSAAIPLIDYEGFCGAPGSDYAADDDPLPEDAKVTALELKARLDAGDPVVHVDVRRQPEWEIVHLEGSLLIPLNELAHRLGELSHNADIVVVCRSGHRSARAVGLLRRHGFERARNLVGGLIAWAQDVDPSIPQY